MGFLKGLFVEEIPNEEEVYATESSYVEEENVEVELDSVNTDTLITDIYTQNELFDKTKSIFKVEELINSLPKEMVTETKKTSVLVTLGVFGLTVTDVTLDGESRIDVLNGVLAKILGEGNDTVVSKETEIEEHKKEIARLEKEISDKKNEMKVSEDTINAEISRITSLLKFVEGGNE